MKIDLTRPQIAALVGATSYAHTQFEDEADDGTLTRERAGEWRAMLNAEEKLRAAYNGARS
jgi:hypothetical protein